MSKSQPKVSIGLPVYNGENYIEEAIQSVLKQTYTNFELVISDNASTDNTAVICQNYAAQDSRVRYCPVTENLGAAWNFNRVFELAHGEYFKWLAHDDLIAPTYLEKCTAILDNDPGVVLSHSQVALINENGDVIQDYEIHLNCNIEPAHRRLKTVMLDFHLCFEVFGLIRTDAIRKTKQVMGNYGHGDGILLERLALMGRFYEVPEVLLYGRKHPNQSMSQYGYSNKGGTNYHTYTVWFDPSKKGKLIFPAWKIVWESYRSLWIIPIKTSDRIAGHFYVIKLIRGRGRMMLHDLEYGVKFLAHRFKSNVAHKHTEIKQPIEN